jgi:hypothetical protein
LLLLEVLKSFVLPIYQKKIPQASYYYSLAGHYHLELSCIS